MARLLVIAEHDGNSLNPSTAKCVACATQIDGVEIDVAVLAASAAGIAGAAAIGFRRFAESRLKTVNGDVIGAWCELSEAVALFTACWIW